MTDIIHLLPDSVANQIAAGEVVQRPASLVKELLENSIDAGSKNITLQIKEAGKALVQVTDDGCGMSETDARMSFERHATSKIFRAEDLYNIMTLGFRGEAMPSIASVAKVELKTRRKNDDNGTFIIVEGGKLKTHEPVACNPGTIISVKNLFYNIPVRKNFLKNDSIEYRHIMEFFQNIVLAEPEIKFVFINDKTETYHLNKGTLRQRITGVFGKRYDGMIVPVNEETPIVKISGFIGKPNAAKKSKGEQYLFVNKRFIKNPFFNHAVFSAYEGLLPAETYPFYVIFMEVPSDKIDVNVHPTKTEVKFAEEKAIYAFLKATVKKSLSQYHVAPSLDFEQVLFDKKNAEDWAGTQTNKLPQVKTGLGSNLEKSQGNLPSSPSKKITTDDWKELLKVLGNEAPVSEQPENTLPESNDTNEIKGDEKFLPVDDIKENRVMQLHRKYIFTPIHSGFMFIHQQYAHERILYEEYCKSIVTRTAFSQKKLFPEVMEFTNPDFNMIKDLMPELENIGFDMDIFGTNSYVVNGVPADLRIDDYQDFIDKFLEDFKNSAGNKEIDRKERIARALAMNTSIKPGTSLTKEEMIMLIDKLFACENPYYSPSGKSVLLTISKDEIDKKFELI